MIAEIEFCQTNKSNRTGEKIYEQMLKKACIVWVWYKNIKRYKFARKQAIIVIICEIQKCISR